MNAKQIINKTTCLLSLLPLVSMASSLQFGIDNDVMFQSDGDYSNGLYISVGDVRQSEAMYGLMQLEQGTHHWSAQLGQKIWTPSDISSSIPLKNERPYAGLLYLALGTGVFNPYKAYNVSLMAGTTGPASGAASLQKTSHRWFGSTTPQGWDYQIKNKWVADLSLEADYLIIRTNGDKPQHELSTFGRLVAGNFQPEVAAGFGWRWGQGLNTEFNSSTLRPFRQQHRTVAGKAGSMYLYSSVELRYRFKDTTISGTTLKPTPVVLLEKIQGSVTVGGATHFDEIGLSFSITGYSQSFKEDKNQWHLISSLALSWAF